MSNWKLAKRASILAAAMAGVGLWAGNAGAAFIDADAVGTQGSGVTASASTVLATGYEAGKVVDWSAMSGTWPDGTHGNTRGVGMWASATTGGAYSQWLAFDFGSEKDLDGFHYWNYNATGLYNNIPRINSGIKTMDIQASTDGSTWTDAFTDVELSKASGLTTYEGDDYELPSVLTTRYLLFKVNSNWNDETTAGYAGFSEVVFYTAPIPEPATIAGVLCLGLPAILRRRRA